MDDERIERARRNFRYSHTELDPPSTLREHLHELEEAAGPEAVSSRLRPKAVGSRLPNVATARREPARAIAATAALVVTVLVGGGMILGLALRPSLPVSGSPTPLPSSGPSGSPSVPPASWTTRSRGPLVSSNEERATYAIGDATTRTLSPTRT